MQRILKDREELAQQGLTRVQKFVFHFGRHSKDDRVENLGEAIEPIGTQYPNHASVAQR